MRGYLRAEWKAALAYEREQKRPRTEGAERRLEAITKAQAALGKAERDHAKRAAVIQAEIDAIEKKGKLPMPIAIR
ncbi:hypothetical protein V4R08_15530 (plasmid) [Nitrobacter sp. NHB1]|uniref:hypothetical protein n=1 Tax=Nitrobacter sp. NHB1 TaxID=3119830 RepID=UPI002FFE353B